MNDANSSADPMNPVDRRHFVRKSAFAAGAVTFAGLIKAGHGQGPPTTSTNTTNVTTTAMNIWWIDYEWAASDSEEIDGGPNDNATEVAEKAIKKRHDRSPGVSDIPEYNPGGTLLKPYEYSPVYATPDGSDPSMSFNQSTQKWTVTFGAGFKYRERHRE